MKIKRFEISGLAQYSYVVSDGGEAVVIDATRDVAQYVEYAQREGLRIKSVVETHIHADYAAGSKELAAVTGAELALSGYDEGERFVYAMPHRSLRDGDVVQTGGVTLCAVHTPGHTPEHLSFLLYEAGAAEATAMFSGDFLFVGSLGRPDLLGEEAKVELAHSLYRSVQAVKALPDEVKVYPGHGAGSLCGAGMGDAEETTLGAERAKNPYFRYAESEFIERILASVPEMPVYYPRMKALNAAGAPSGSPRPGGVALRVDAVRAVLGSDVVLLDVRTPEAFAAAHIPGSVHIGEGLSFSLWAGWLLDAETAIVLIGDGGDLAKVQWSLIDVGLDRIPGYLDGGFAAWVAAGEPVDSLTQRGVGDVKALGGRALVLDVRNRAEWKSGHIAGASHVALGDLPRAMEQVPRGREVVTVCGSGYRASVAASLLERAGVAPVSRMEGGMAAWLQAGLPVISGE